MKKLILCAVLVGLVCECVGKVKVKHIKQVDNIKEYKKVLKTHKNVMTIYSKEDKPALPLIRWMEDVAKDVKGKGTFVYINCGETKESKKLCKKFDIKPKPTLLKHYKDGVFNKDYDRKETPKSMLNFMLDPTGDAPWEEDPTAKNVIHVTTEKELIKLRRKEKGPLLIMFYAPWCGYCKKLKPEYANAANELKDKAVLAGMNVDKPEIQNVRHEFNITGFPTILYFEKGEKKFNYGGGMDKDGIVTWMGNPEEKGDTKEDEEEAWSDTAPQVLHLTDATFDEKLKENPSILIMFYAPWCGHCKKMKPEYVSAAIEMKANEINGALAAVDCTISKEVCKKYDVSGYPTVKYFAEGEFKFKVSLRESKKIVEFMTKPEAPPPPPPEDLPWAESSGPEVIHLDDATYKDVLKKKKHVLVMFYAPWCGHCKKAKPEMQEAAEHYKDDRKIWFAGIDCTVETKVCGLYEVQGYPTFRYFLYGKKDFKYSGGRSKQGFIDFMVNPVEKIESGGDDDVEPPQWKDTPSGVVHLEDSDFDEFIKTHPSVLVMFYAPWCGHCKQMKPEYTEAANELLNQDHVVAAVDCTKNRRTASAHDINGYPTLKYFKQGVGEEYNSGRSKAAIIQFLTGDHAEAKAAKEEEAPPPEEAKWSDYSAHVLHLEGTFNFNEAIESDASVLVMFYAPWCGHCKKMKPEYDEVAIMINTENKVAGKLAAVDCTAMENENVCKKYEVKGYPTLKYFKDGKEGFKYTGGRKKRDLIEFMMDPKPAAPKAVEKSWSEEDTDVAHLTKDTFKEFLRSETHVLVMFYAPWCGHCKKMKPAFAEAAKIVNNDEKIDGKLAAVDCDAHPVLSERYEVKGYPTLKYFRKGGDFLKYTGGRDAASFVDFIKTADLKTQKQWSDEPSEVRHLTNKTFHDFIKDNDVLVMFYAPWCGHCNSMKGAYTEAAQALKDDHFPGRLAAVDATQARNLSKEEGVSGYPTLRYYSNGKFVVKFEEHRTVENLLTFMKTQFEPDGWKPTTFDQQQWSELPSSVTHLTHDTFHTVLESKEVPHVLVAFHIKWCKNCLNMRNVFMKVASRLPGSLAIAAIDCDVHTDKCSDQGVTTFPTMKYYNLGSFNENYSGKVDTESVLNYMLEKLKEQGKDEL